ncbi:MAG: helicase HerA-like domain-containing protein [Fimbriimonas sp.]
MESAAAISLGSASDPALLLEYANRHGIIAGATGTGKTVTLQTLVEGFSSAGVPVFLADVKGDLSGLAEPGGNNPKLEAREAELGLTDRSHTGFPVTFWDVYARKGLAIRTTVSEMGPLLLARMLDLNATQQGVLNLAFQVADDQGLLLLDLKDLRSMLAYVSEKAPELKVTYGNVSASSIGAIQRQLLELDQQDGAAFFGEPALELTDLMRTENGRGVINLLVSDQLVQQPRLYATVLLWILSELFEDLPEAGDLDRPKLVFVFDEAHLLFEDATEALTDKIEQVVRLVRSKGVGVYFVTQNPLDIPETVLGQLGNRVQHALRAFTPKDQKSVKTAAQTFRANPDIDTEEAITQLGIGEALVSVLQEDGTPSIVQRVKIRPPLSRVGPAQGPPPFSPLAGKYEHTIDRESAYELLTRRAELMQEVERQEQIRRPVPQVRQQGPRPTPRVPREQPGVFDTVLKAAGSQIGRSLGRELVRGVLGSFMKRR